MRFFLYSYRHRLALGLMVAVIGWLFFWQRIPIPGLAPGGGAVDLLATVRDAPFPLFILLVGFLPICGVPVTALYLAAGAVYAPVFGYPLTLVGLGLGLGLNFSLSYAAARFLHSPVERVLRRFGRNVPTFSGMRPWKLILLVRVTPGAPLMVQNLLLGLAGVSFGLYLTISLLVEMAIACGYLTAGQSFATGRWGLLALGAGVVVGAILLTSLLRKRVKSKGVEN